MSASIRARISSMTSSEFACRGFSNNLFSLTKRSATAAISSEDEDEDDEDDGVEADMPPKPSGARLGRVENGAALWTS